MTHRNFALAGGKIGTIIAVLVLLVWSVGPIYWSLATSFTSPTDLISAEPHFGPQT